MIFKLLFFIIFFIIHSGFVFVIVQGLLFKFIGFDSMVLIICISVLLRIYDKKNIDTVKLKEDFDYYKKYLYFYYMRNFNLTILSVLLYFLMSGIIFVILRYKL